MNIKIAKESLLPVLTRVTRVVEKRQTLPILANLFFNYSNEELNVVGTDLEVEMSEKIKNVSGDDTSFTVSSRKIFDITRNLPENSIMSLTYESGKILVSSGRSRYTLKTIPPEEFPRIDVSDWEESFKISQLSLKMLLDKTAFSMGVQDVRYYLNGVLFEFTRNQLRSIATDGHRLAQSDVDISLETTDSRQVIVPRKAIGEINRFLDGEDDTEILIEINKNHLKLTSGETTLITKLIDGKFPEFKDMLERQPNIILTINKIEFIEAMVRAAVLVTEKFMGVKVTLESGVMRITTTTLEQEEAVEELAIDYTGEKIEIGYNVTYLIDVARAINTEHIEINLQGEDGVCIIKQPGDDRSIWLVMPLRI